MKTSEALRRVRGHLVDVWSIDTPMHKRYICYAANEAYLRGYIGDRDRTKVKKIINTLLGSGAGTLEWWLYEHHNITCTRSPRYNKKIMATRKAWLTHLIEHYEAKGD